MKVLLTPAMAQELYDNEDMIKAQEGLYRPQFRSRILSPSPGVTVVSKEYVPVIKVWPLEKFNGKFIQEREVIPGLEDEVDDICMAKIEDDHIKYKVLDSKTRVEWAEDTLDIYNLIIYTPNFNEKTILLKGSTLPARFDKLKEYKIVGEKEEEDRNRGRKSWGVVFNDIDEWFKRYQGICTYIFITGDKVTGCGKWDNKKYW